MMILNPFAKLVHIGLVWTAAFSINVHAASSQAPTKTSQPKLSAKDFIAKEGSEPFKRFNALNEVHTALRDPQVSAEEMRALAIKKAQEVKASVKEFINTKHLILNATEEKKQLLLQVNQLNDITYAYLIHCAAAHHDAEKLRVLLELGANVETRAFPSGHTPLMVAITEALPLHVHYLLEYGASPFATLREDDPANSFKIAFASLNINKPKDLLTIKVLLGSRHALEAEAIASFPKKMPDKLLGYKVSLMYSIKRPPYNENDPLTFVPQSPLGDLPTHSIAELGHVELVQPLANLCKFTVFHYNDQGFLPLHIALQEALTVQQFFGFIPHRYLATIDALLKEAPHTLNGPMRLKTEAKTEGEKHANTNRFGQTPLYQAVLGKNLELIEMLITRGANPDGEITASPDAPTFIARTPRLLAQQKGIGAEFERIVNNRNAKIQFFGSEDDQRTALEKMQETELNNLQENACNEGMLIAFALPFFDIQRFMIYQSETIKHLLLRPLELSVGEASARRKVEKQAAKEMMRLERSWEEESSELKRYATSMKVSAKQPELARYVNNLIFAEARDRHALESLYLRERNKLADRRELELQLLKAKEEETKLAEKEAKRSQRKQENKAKKEALRTLKSLLRSLQERQLEERYLLEEEEKLSLQTLDNEFFEDIIKRAADKGLVGNILCALTTYKLPIHHAASLLETYPSIDLANTPCSITLDNGEHRLVTPLALAVSTDNKPMVELLLKHGARTETLSKTRESSIARTPLVIAVEQGKSSNRENVKVRNELIDLLRKHTRVISQRSNDPYAASVIPEEEEDF